MMRHMGWRALVGLGCCLLAGACRSLNGSDSECKEKSLGDRLETAVMRWPSLHEWDSPEPLGRMAESAAYEWLVSRNPSLKGKSQRTWLFAGDVVCKGLVGDLEAPSDLGRLTDSIPYAIGIMRVGGLGVLPQHIRTMAVGDVVGLRVVRDELARVVGHEIVEVEEDMSSMQFILVACRHRLFAVCLSDHEGMHGVLHRVGAVACLVSRWGGLEGGVWSGRDDIQMRLSKSPALRRISDALGSCGMTGAEVLSWWAFAAGVVVSDGKQGELDGLMNMVRDRSPLVQGEGWGVWRVNSGVIVGRVSRGAWCVNVDESVILQWDR